MMNAVRHKYRERFGAPSREAAFRTPDKGVVEVWKWSQEETGEGVCIYATIGGVAHLRTPDRACEFFVGLLPEVDTIASALAETALEGTGSGKPPLPGDTITLAQPLWNGTGMRTFLFADRGDQIISPIENENIVIEFIQLVPIFQDELAYKIQHSDRGLWALFEKHEVAYWDSRRSSVLKR